MIEYNKGFAGGHDTHLFLYKVYGKVRLNRGESA